MKKIPIQQNIFKTLSLAELFGIGFLLNNIIKYLKQTSERIKEFFPIQNPSINIESRIL